MLNVILTMNPWAVEIHRDDRSIATIRWHDGQWSLWSAEVVIPWDVLEIAMDFKRGKQAYDHAYSLSR